MPQLTEPANLPSPPYNGTTHVFENTTIRQTVRVSLPAQQIRFKISNNFGTTPLIIDQVTVARPGPNSTSSGSPLITEGTSQHLLFSGNQSISIPNGGLAVTDAVSLDIEAGTDLSISMYLSSGQAGFAITSHPGSRTTSWLATGDQTSQTNLTGPNVQSLAHWYYISAVEGWVDKQSKGLVIIGDSITDGRGSTTDGNDRWTDALRDRIQADGRTAHVAVLNQGAGGNRILADGLGPNAFGRIERDVIAQPGVGYAMIFEGVNDIGTAANTSSAQKEVYEQLVQAYQQMITRIHAFQIPVFGGTITPFSAPNSTIQPYSDPVREDTRQRVNEWIRTSGKFDYVVDFDKVAADPAMPTQLNPLYNSGDYLHLNPEGYRAFAEAFDLGVFERFKDGAEGFD